MAQRPLSVVSFESADETPSKLSVVAFEPFERPKPSAARGFTDPESLRVFPTNETTTLSADDETRFQRWVKTNKITDVDKPGSFYDYRGYWQEHGDTPIRFGVDHFPDTYKQHGHPTFSVESKYSTGPRDGGTWLGDTLVTPEELDVIAQSEPMRALPPILPTPAKPPAPTPRETVVSRGNVLSVTEDPNAPPPPDWMTEGAKQIGRGIAKGSKYYGQSTDETLDAASDVLEGAMKLGTPLAVAGAVADLPAALVTLGISLAAGKGAQKAAEFANASPSMQRFLGNLASAATVVVGGRGVLESAKTGTASTARAVALAAKLSGRAVGEARPVGRAATVAEASAVTRPGAHAPIEAIDRPAPSSVELPPGSGAPETLTDIVRTAMAPEPPALKIGEGAPRSAPRTTTTAGSEQFTADRRELEEAAQQGEDAIRAKGHEATRALESYLRTTGQVEEANKLRLTRPDAFEPGPRSEAERAHEARMEAARREAEQIQLESFTPAEPQEHDYSSTQIELPANIAEKIALVGRNVRKEDLTEDGREADPHVTVKFGIHGADPEPLRKLLADEPPITVTLGKASIFPASETGDADVVKIDIDSPDLHRLNAKIAEAVETTDTHPEYKPHATIAYVKAGEGQKYAAWLNKSGYGGLEGQTFTIDHVTFSAKDGTQVAIPLGGKQEPGTAVPKPSGDYLYHGTSGERSALSAGSYFTASKDEAAMWALTRAKQRGGSPRVYAVPRAEVEAAASEILPEGAFRSGVEHSAVDVTDEVIATETPEQLEESVKPAPPATTPATAAIKPRTPTPQLPPPGGAGYVLPSFATAPYTNKPVASKPPPVESAESPAVGTTKPLHVRAFDTLRARLAQWGANGIWKNAAEFRKRLAGELGVKEQALIVDIDAANDAMEAAYADHLRQRDLKESHQPTEQRITLALAIEAAIPRAHRTLEKMKLQQFSTPLPIAEGAFAAAAVRAGDVVLEPTAGTGNLLAPVETPGATTLAIELAPRRADLLRAQGYSVQDGDYLATKPTQQPTVIISNPPWGKYSKGKYGKAVGLDFTPIDVAERFFAKMYRDVAPGGRIVAVMPTTILAQMSGFRRWLRDSVTVRAIIKSPPGAYDTRATNVESLLLVVDKVKPETPQTVPAVVAAKTWGEYADLVDAIPARAESRRSAEGRPPEAPRPAAGGGPEQLPERPRPELADVGRDTPVPSGRDTGVVAGQPGPAPRREPEAPGPPVVDQPERATISALAQPAGEFADVVDHTADDRRDAAGSRHFAPYVRRTPLRGVGHPKLIVEARQLAGVSYPPLTEQPGKAVTTALREKRVSVEQAEQALAAVQANVVGHHGYLAADNVGVGKSREIALTILELMERAKADDRDLRLIVTTKSGDNIANLIDEEVYYVATGRTRDGLDLLNVDAPRVIPEALDFEIVKTADWPDAKREGNEYKPLPQHKRALYVTDFYNLAPFRQALVDAQPHGIIGDEAHRFKNVEGAAAGGAWQNLHAQIMRNVPREEQAFAYFTATPAQDVNDYQYLYGLRLWPIDGFQQWVNLATGAGDEKDAAALAAATDDGAFNIDHVADSDGATVIGGDSEDVAKTDKPTKWGSSRGGDVFKARLTPAEAEQIPREWKMLGRFSARDLWRAGQEFTVHEATLAPHHVAKYDQFAELAQDIARKAHQFGLLDKSGKSSRFGVTGQLQFAAKRIQMQPALEEAIRLAQGKVAEGYQVVLSVINVTEMDPEKGNIAAAIEKINDRVKDVDPDDPDGGVLDMGEIPEAIVAKAELLEQAKALGKFDDPIKMVEDAFGAERVAFIIGGAGTSRRVAMKAFQEGKRVVAVLSQAGATGINLDHRVLTDVEPGRGRRVFVDVQFEWSATEAIQRYGRVGRAASVTQPVLMPLTFGNASEKKFLATIANRMAALGALSKGGAETTGAAGLEEFEITGPDAAQAARLAYNDLSHDDKRKFAVVKSVFRSPNRGGQDPFEPATIAPSAVGMRDVQLALLFVPMHTSNAFWQSFITHREQVREALGHAASSRTEALSGDVLRTTDLGTKDAPLTLTEVKNQKGQRFGVLSGLITPRMPKIRDFLMSENPDTHMQEFRRRYVTFTAGDQIVSGLQIPWSRVKALADAFGHDLATDKLDTPEKVLAALKAGEKVTLQQETDSTPWVLHFRSKDERIAINGAKMADRALLLHNGAGYSPVGNYWFTTEEKLAQFLERFPVAEPKAAKADKGGTTLQMAVVPGAHLLTPAVEAAAVAIQKDVNLLQRIIAPATVSPEAKAGAAAIRPHFSVKDQLIGRLHRNHEIIARAMDGWSHDESLAFWDVMEGQADISTLPAAWQPVAVAFRQILDGWTKKVVDRDLIRRYIENYWGHEWVRPGTNLFQRFMGRRPLAGRESYRKHRTIPTMREGIALGLEPFTWNPARQLERKVAEMARSVMAHDIRRDLTKQRFRVFVPATRRAPEGWVQDKDRGAVYGPRTVQDAEGNAIRLPFGRLVAGHYYLQPDVARLLENHLSPGLWGTSAALDLYRVLGNVTSQVLLGWSSFHLWMTGIESVISKQTAVAEALQAGQGARAARLQAWVGPHGLVRDLVRGWMAVREFYADDAEASDVSTMIGQIINAGGGFNWNEFEHENAPKRFMQEMRTLGGALRRLDLAMAAREAPKVAGYAALATIELPTHLIMTHWVPYLKASAFLDLAAIELERLGRTATLAEKRQALQAGWEAVDDRLGQLRRDNLFWNRTMSDALTASFLSVTWNLGSLRHGMMAVPAQVGRIRRNIAAGGGGRGLPPGPPEVPMRRAGTGPGGTPVYARREPWVHRRMLWLFTGALIVGTMGAIRQYLMTGKRPGEEFEGTPHYPEEALRDLFFPRNGRRDANGREERDSPITYAKDFYAWAKHPWATFTHKLKPFAQDLYEIVTNRDFFGNAFRNPDDPLLTQLTDTLKHWLSIERPIAWTNAERRAGEAASFGTTLREWLILQATPFVPAPAEVEKSDLENYLDSIRPPVYRTKEQAERATERRALRQAARETPPGGTRQPTPTQHLSPQDMKRTLRTARVAGYALALRQASFEQALKAYTLATPEERTMIRATVANKLPGALASTPPSERPTLMAKFREAMKLPVAKKAAGF